MKKIFSEFILDLLSIKECKIGKSGDENQIRSTCPFHLNDKNSTVFSINLNDEIGLYRCFSCGEQGNIFRLISHIYNCSYKKAEKIFLRKVAISPINLQTIRDSLYSLPKGKIIEEEDYPTIDLPPKFSSKQMIKYLEMRNRNEQHSIMNIPYIVSLYKLFYCDSGRYAKRIIMPIRNTKGRTVFFTNRSIYHDSERKNLFPFGGNTINFLYGLFESLGREKVIIVEGPFEVFQFMSFCLKHKILNWGCVALMGTEMTEERATLISTFFKEAYVCLDHEPATFKKDRKSHKNKEEKIYSILNDFMPTWKITDQLYPGKEIATSTEEQIMKLIKFKAKHGLLCQI